jgi:DNA-binding FadR family transcriptional regulator
MAADRQFHRYIAAKLANKPILRLVTGLFDQGYSPLARRFATHFDNAKSWATVLTEHRKIVTALASRQPEEARKAMRDHLRKVHNRWAQNIDRGAKTGLAT